MTNKHHLTGLYAITDNQLLPQEKLFSAVAAALAGGAQIIQYRDKTSNSEVKKQTATRLMSLCHQHKKPLIINDDIQLAAEIGADGVHLGLTDGSITEARKILGDKAIIGATCHDSLDNAKHAANAGANYLAFGRFFNSKTKPDAPAANINVIAQAKTLFQLPIVAIGGITLENASIAINQGADMIAVVHSLFSASDIAQQATNFQSHFNKEQA